MNSILLLLVFLLISSQTYISYILFILTMLHIILYIFILGNYYIGIIYLMIYIGSIAILFIYILMVLSIIESNRYGYILFILPFILLSITIIGIYLPSYGMVFNILTISHNIYNNILIPIALIIFIAMIFAIRSI